MNKKYIFVFGVVLLILCGAIGFVVSKKIPASSPENNIVKWAKYHNEKYGFSVSYPDYLKITDSGRKNNPSYDEYMNWAKLGKNGTNEIIFSDGMLLFAVDVIDTSLSLKDYTSAMLKAEKIKNEKEGHQFSFTITVIDKETTISGLPAILFHQEINKESYPASGENKHLLVKKGDIMFEFQGRIGSPFDEKVIQSISFN